MDGCVRVCGEEGEGEKGELVTKLCISVLFIDFRTTCTRIILIVNLPCNLITEIILMKVYNMTIQCLVSSPKCVVLRT